MSSFLLHIRPRLFIPLREVALIDLHIEPFGLHLRGGIDLKTRRPYRNKHYAVGCRREGRKAVDGILLETSTPPNEFHVTARWAIAAEFAVTHRVHYRLLDHEFDAASDDMTLWYATSPSLGGWGSRWPIAAKDLSPAIAAPKMEVIDRDIICSTREDFHDARGRIVERREVFSMPTIERERILQVGWNGIARPETHSAFQAQFSP